MQTSLRPGGPSLTLPDYWQPLRALPDDPPDTRAFAFTFRDGATGSAMMNPIPPDEAMPLDQKESIDGLRGRRGPRRPSRPHRRRCPRTASGIHYNLPLHLVGEPTLQVRNGFDEGDLTGPRESLVYEIAQRHTRLQEPPKGDPIAIARFAKEVSGSLGECRRTWWSSFE